MTLSNQCCPIFTSLHPASQMRLYGALGFTLILAVLIIASDLDMLLNRLRKVLFCVIVSLNHLLGFFNRLQSLVLHTVCFLESLFNFNINLVVMSK